MDKVDEMIMIKQNYGNHPCGSKFCAKCDWIMMPPSYPGDYWDCTNKDCQNTKAPTKAEIQKMQPKIK